MYLRPEISILSRNQQTVAGSHIYIGKSQTIQRQINVLYVLVLLDLMRKQKYK